MVLREVEMTEGQTYWEYLVAYDGPVDWLPDYLSEVGKEGWELVTVDNTGRMIFKRQATWRVK